MSLVGLRKKIDAVDKRIVSLLSARAHVSALIGKEKRRQNKSVYSPDREKEVLEKVKALSKGAISPSAVEAIYREIMSYSLSLEKPLDIAYMGPQASFSNLAALKKFGSQVNYIPCDSISEVFQRVEKEECDYGVVPIENSIEGAVTHTFDLLVDSELKICSQLFLEISHNLLSKTTMNKIKEVYSNPQVFGQCRIWLQNNLPKAECVEVSSTTKAAQIAAKTKNSACIASTLAAKVYNLKILKKDIEDTLHNITKFLVISRTDVPATGKDRTSILFSIKDRVGALQEMLSPFRKNNLNLTKIESRPSKKKAWDYYFFVDIEGHRLDKPVARALCELEDKCNYLKILGSYPVVD